MTNRGAMTKESLLVVLVVLIVLAVAFGGFGAPHSWGNWGWSPAGLLIVVLILYALFG